MSFSVDCSMIKQFEVSDNCILGYYSHRCTITLFDGRVKRATLEHDVIDAFIKAIAADKLVCKWDLDHFKESSKDWPNQILTRLFKNEVSEIADSSLMFTLDELDPYVLKRDIK